MINFEELVNYAKQNNASDIHLSANHPPILRTIGDMVPMRLPPLTAQEVEALLHSIMNEEQKKIYAKEHDFDFSIYIGESRFRVNAFFTLNGPAAVLRTIPTKVKTLEELKTPEIIAQICGLHKGLVLVTGPTGSGKSTTLSAMINHININDSKHIITLEDPVEFVHASKKSLLNQREIGAHTNSFEQAIRSALREDPDIVLVGEMRDQKTIHAALTCAETGHLVFGTLHTNSAPKTIDRIIDVFSSEDKAMVRTMLASTIEAVIAQRLVKTADGKARVAIYEVMIATDAVRNLIRESKIAQLNSVIQTGSRVGMIAMNDYAKKLFSEGIIGQEGLESVTGKADNIGQPHAAVAATKSESKDGSGSASVESNSGEF